MRLPLIKKNKAFQKSYMTVGVKKLLRVSTIAARTWGVHTVGMSRTERLNMRRHVSAAAGKLFMEAYGLEVEEELSTMATQYWAEGVWTGGTNKKKRGGGKFKRFRRGTR